MITNIKIAFVIFLIISILASVFMFGVTASAEVIITEDSVLIRAGSYRFNDDLGLIVESGDITLSADFNFSVSPDFSVIDNNVVLGSGSVPFYGITITRTNSGSGSTVSFIDADLTDQLVYTQAYVQLGAPGWSGILSSVAQSYPNVNVDSASALYGWGQTITIPEDVVLSGTEGIAFGTLFNDITTSLSPPPTVTFESGYYDLKVPYVNIDASWIGESGQSVYYPIQCQVVNGFNDYVECNGFGIEYISNDNGYTTLWYVDIAGLRYDWFSLVSVRGSDGVTNTSLRLLGGDYGLNATKVYFPSSFEMDDGPGAVQFFSTFERTTAPPYDGNVFFDIVDAVVEALDVDVFGYFSPLDVIKSIAGLMLGLWLLKLLAGG